MASTSSNNPSPVSNNNVCKYDVFLSFRGETRQAFTDHLYKALVDAGLIPFRDNDDIERGEDLQPEIERGIRESRASVVVLSELYATSRWCLDELCLILEQATKRRHFVLPIFYHVVPSHVKKQEGSFEINVKRDTKWTEDNVERWKAALTRVGNMHGEVLNGPETKFLEKVVGIIEKRLDLKKVYHKANLVGMDTRRKEINNWLENSSAQILAVWGIGGNGKTTLARHIVYSNWENFGSISILEDIGSKSTEQLHELQQKLLRDILQGKKRKIPSVWQGTCKIENALQTEKALIVLDNIVEPSQLFVLLGTGIETQCKIIITTRKRNPHKWFDQSTSWRCQELEMKSLDIDDSLELLSLHAFGSKAPTEGYDHLVEKALWYCEGNPLALEVLGSSLSQNNKQLWESRLNEFGKELDARIHNVLKGSYEALPLESHRDLFLHIACFFVGKNIDYVVKILEPDYSALSGIETLFKSCLLSVSPNKKLMMHKMLQEMARTIVFKESPKNPAKRSRVWRDKESYDILQEGKGSKKIEGLALDIKLLNQGKESYEYESSDLTTESFKKMDKLKLLQLNSVDLTGSYDNFSKKFRWLCWTGFSLRAIPSELYMKNLVAIDMSYSCLEDFEPPVDLLSLKILNLRSSKDLREIHNIYRLRYLEILILWDCRSLTHVNLGDLTCLAILNLTGCKKLCRREEISPLVSEEGLFQKIKRKLSLEGSSLHATKSTQQASFLLPQSLERLYLMNCNLSDTDYFPLTFKDQPLLIYLNLVNSPFELLPSYNYLKRLRVLDVSGCSDLKELQCLPSTLAELYIYYCNSLNIVAFESHRFTLQEFGYEGCVNLCEVEGLFKLMPITKLEESDLKHMTWLREYQDLTVCLVGDAELTKGRSSCVQMLYEFNIMSTSLPNIKNSNMMTDTDYMYTSQSTLLSFKVPACPNHRRLEGLIISFQYTTHGEDWVWFAKISTPSGVNLMYNPRVFGKPDEVGMWSSYWPIAKALQIEETVTVSIVVIKGLLDIHWCGARLVYTDEAANEHLQENRECVAILGEDFSEFQLSTGDYYLCCRDFFELMEAGKLTPDWFRILVDDKINYTEVGGWRMTGKPEHPYQSYTEVKTIKCIMYGPEMEDFYKIAELSKPSLTDKTKKSTSVLSFTKPKNLDSFCIKMGTDVAEVVEKLPSPCDIKVHSVMCTELMKLVDRVERIFPEIEAARPRCSSGIQSLCLLNSGIDKAKLLVRDCSESSKLYLALTGNTILSRCKKSKSLLEQSLTQIQNMVPVMLESKISQIIAELRRIKFSLDPSDEEAGQAIRSLLEGYRTGNPSKKETSIDYIRVAAQKLQITSQKSLLIERRSIKKLLDQIDEGNNKQQKKQILLFLLDLLKKYGKSITSGCIDNDNILENQSYRPRKVDVYVDREEDPPEEFKCPISLKLMYDPVVIDSGQTFERMWIQKWFDEGHDVCPLTKRKLSNISLIPNTAMKDLISKWCGIHGITVSDPSIQVSTDSNTWEHSSSSVTNLSSMYSLSSVTVSDPSIQVSTDSNTWEHSSSSVTSLSSMYSLQLPVDYSNLSLGSLDNSRTLQDTREFDMGLSQELDGALPWKFQCKFVENLMTRLKNDDQAYKLMSCENLVGSLVRFLKVSHDLNDVKAQRIGCLLLLILISKCRGIRYLSEDAYRLIAEFLESEVIEEALAITEELSSHENCRSEIVSSGSLSRIFKLLETQIREIQTPALKIIYNLTLTRNVRSLIVSSDLIPKLVTLSEDDSLSSYCIAILTNLCGNQDNKSIIAETNGCIPFIVRILEGESCEEQEQALEILLSLCSQSIQYCHLVMDEGVIPSVVSISIYGNDNGKAKAREMLRLLRDVEHEENVEESVAPVYDISNDTNSLQVEKKTSKTSRILSKLSLTSRGPFAKRKV